MRELRGILVLFFIFNVIFQFYGFAQRSILVDDFEDISGWDSVESEGVEVKIYQGEGVKGRSIRLDFEFKLGSGYCGVRKRINLQLPGNFQFRFYLKGECMPNNLEFKLIDSTGENVWWLNQRNFNFPRNWAQIKIKKRNIGFAWGPRGGGEIDRVGYIEIIISSSSGGRGSIWIDEISMDELEADSVRRDISNFDFQATSGEASFLFDKNPETSWKTNEDSSFILLDFKTEKEVGGFVIDFNRKDYARRYEILTSNDGETWTEVYKVGNGHGGRNYIYLKDCEARFFKIRLHDLPTGRCEIFEIIPQDVKLWASINDFFRGIAFDYPYGYFPKYLRDKQVYWTVIGLPGDEKEALVSETGAIEVDKLGFTLEPFVFLDGKIFTWADVRIEQELESGYLPIPSVMWFSNQFKLEIKCFVSGYPDSSFIIVRYKLKNLLSSRLKGKFFIAIRSFQVLPPWQQLNITGGVSQIKNIRVLDDGIVVNDDKRIIFLDNKPDKVGLSEFDHGEIINFIKDGLLPGGEVANDLKEVYCHFGCASGAIEYNFDLRGGGEISFYLAVTLSGSGDFSLRQIKGVKFERELGKVVELWEGLLNKVKIDIPDKKLLNTFRSNLAYILINADKLALQPGSRTYERSWIRDGVIISNALLYSGLFGYVKRYLDWYSNYQYESGKIPCVVDHRGPDPVPEHDSNGEFIYAIAQYYRFTQDSVFLLNKFKRVEGAVRYIDYLTSLRKTDEFRTVEKMAYYGLLTESISHEGYSAKPMHSYWDNFWALCGLESAEFIVSELLNKGFFLSRGEGFRLDSGYLNYLSEMKREFRKNLYNSIELAIKGKGIDFIPGCVELGDFDPASTSIAILPTFALVNPEATDRLGVYLSNTFRKYYEFFREREKIFNVNQLVRNYTPYELRIINAFIYMGYREIAHEMLSFFISHQRPFNWNMWAEVVWNDYEYPGFIGDMPHSWVGAEFINSIRNMLVYENYDSTLVVGAGVKEEWLLSGGKVAVEDLPTYFGGISFDMRIDRSGGGERVVVNIGGDERLRERVNLGLIPGVRVKNPLGKKPLYIVVGGVKRISGEEVLVRELPVRVEFVY